MRFKILNIFLIFLIVTSLAMIIIPSMKATGNEIFVKGDYFGSIDGSAEKPYNSIDEALDIAEEGDIIYIFGGLYQENLVINKKIKLVGGIDEKETIIYPRSDRRYLVEITADEVTLEGITFNDIDSRMTSPIGALLSINSNNNAVVRNVFTNVSSNGIYIGPFANNNIISNNFVNYTRRGIHISSSFTNDLAKNSINYASEYGIYMDSSGGNNRLYANEINNCPYGVYIVSSNNINLTYNAIAGSEYYAIYLYSSSGGVITNNEIIENIGEGLFLSSSDCLIKNNTMQDNRRGIYIAGSDNLIMNNTLRNNSASGIYIKPGSSNNVMYLNKFLYNGLSAKDLGRNNVWFNWSRGNYWSDYDNVDKDLDKIGDVIYSNEGVFDLYPLGYFLKPPNKPSGPDPEDTETDVKLDINLEVHVDDPDSDFLDVYFYRADTNSLIESQTTNPVTHAYNDTRVNCRFTLDFDTTFAWYVMVDDGLLQNVSDTFFFYTTRTPPDNEPPVAEPGGPYYAKVNETITFDASNSYDPDGEIDFYRWNFGDGTSEILSISPAHTYYDSGTFSVALTVIDDNGSSATEIVKAYISSTAVGDQPPIADPGGPYSGVVGQSINFYGSKSRDKDYGGILTSYFWDFGDGTTSSLENPTKTYTFAGNFTVSLTVVDGTGLEDTETIYALIKTKSSEESPGFEAIFTLIIIICMVVILSKKNKK